MPGRSLLWLKQKSDTTTVKENTLFNLNRLIYKWGTEAQQLKQLTGVSELVSGSGKGRI